VVAAGGIAVREVEDDAVLAQLKEKAIALVVVTVDEKRSAIGSSRALRVATLASGAVYCTTIAAAEACAEAIKYAQQPPSLYSVQHLHALAAQAREAAQPQGRRTPSADAVSACRP
jgi:carbamoyl-phosphate synthase large subunit